MTSQSSVIPGGEFNKYLHCRRLELYARPPRRARLRAAFRAAAERFFLPLVNAARVAAAERSALDRFRAAARACFDSAFFDVTLVSSR